MTEPKSRRPNGRNPQYVVECFQAIIGVLMDLEHLGLNPQCVVECFQGAPFGNPLKYWVPEGIFQPARFEHYL